MSPLIEFKLSVPTSSSLHTRVAIRLSSVKMRLHVRTYFLYLVVGCIVVFFTLYSVGDYLNLSPGHAEQRGSSPHQLQHSSGTAVACNVSAPTQHKTGPVKSCATCCYQYTPSSHVLSDFIELSPSQLAERHCQKKLPQAIIVGRYI